MNTILVITSSKQESYKIIPSYVIMGKKILIIDDNPSISKLLEKSLTMSNYHCTVCNDGRNAISLIESDDYDVILLDWMMPEFSGHDVLSELEKRNKIIKNNIYVFTAADIHQSDIDDLLKRGVKSCIMKPVKSETLKTITGL